MTNGAGAPASNPSYSGEACFSCHASNGATLVFGGTVYSNGSGAPGVTVNVGGMTIISDTAGNFYASGTSLTSGSANVDICPNTDQIMTESLNSGDCNSCHSSTGTNPGPITTGG